MPDDVEEIKLNVLVQDALDDLVREGLVEMLIGEDGVPRYRLTDRGREYARHLIEGGFNEEG